MGMWKNMFFFVGWGGGVNEGLGHLQNFAPCFQWLKRYNHVIHYYFAKEDLSLKLDEIPKSHSHSKQFFFNLWNADKKKLIR